MDLLVFSDNNSIRNCFAAIQRSRKHAVRYRSGDELSGWVRNGGGRSLVYVDVGGMSETQRTKLLRQLSRRTHVIYGVVDPGNQISDPAAVLRGGAVDYVNRALFSGGVSPKRIDEVADYVKSIYPDPLPTPTDHERDSPGTTADVRNMVVSGDDWSRVRSSREYTFYMLFAELDNTIDYNNHTSERYTLSVVESFQRVLEQATTPYQGRLWMWHDFGGVVLFPFNGESCRAILPCIRMILNRPLDNVEQFDLRTGLSYRLSLHLGNTVYRPKGDTGQIVSDSINFLHHLGQRFTLPGNFTLTEYVYHRIPESLRSLFYPLGDYEGRTVYRMRLPVRPS